MPNTIEQLVAAIEQLAARVRHLETAENSGGVTPSTHATSHQNGGSDEISVAGLSGVLADRQDANKLYGYDVSSTTPAAGNFLIFGTSWAPGPLVLKDAGIKTIASGAINAAGVNYCRLETEGSAASDDLDTINGGTSGQVLVLQTQAATRDVVVKHNTGNIRLGGAIDFTLAHYRDKLTLFYSANGEWCELSRSTNV